MTHPAVNRQDTLNLLYAETGWIKHNYKSPAFVNPAWLGTISRQYIFGLRHWNHALINHWIILFKSSISLHGWFLLWLSITSIMIKVFKVALAQWLLFINGYDLFYNWRNSPKSLQAYDPALGGYIIQAEITWNMQCHCQHAPWHLGANAKSFFAHLIKYPTHHIIMSRPLGATNCSCQQFKLQSFLFIILKGTLLSW